METAVLLLFAAGLVLCLVLGLSLLYALAAGLVLFLLYGLKKGFSFGALVKMCASGVREAGNILITFMLIGMLTALWRASGTIAVLVTYASALIRPPVFLLMTFLLNAGVSVLTGTSLGTAATVGVITATMGRALGVPVLYTGGAVLAGAYFGDRSSPVSTSALLVSEQTGTDIFENLRAMFRTALVPFLICCVLYLLLGFFTPHAGEAVSLGGVFETEYRLTPVLLVPALAVLVCAAFRLRVKAIMTVGILTGAVLALWVQKIPPLTLLGYCVTGYTAKQPAVAAMMDGGGLVSMLRVGAIVCISSAYSGIFRETGLLDGIGRRITAWSEKLTPFGAMLVTSAGMSMLACNQTLAIMLTNRLCSACVPDDKQRALYLENSVVVLAPLVPWSVAGAVPLATVGAGAASLPFAFYLYLLPLCRLAAELAGRNRTKPD